MHRTLLSSLATLCLIMNPALGGQDTAQEVMLGGQDTAQEVEKQTKETRTPDVVFVPTPHEVVEKMLELARVKKCDLVYDLGCGDGRIVVAAAKKYGCKCAGYDIDPERIKESLENVKKNKVEHLVKIERQDIFKLDLSRANVITLYLLPELNVRLIPQLEKLKPGSRIVSHDFRMKGVKPDKVVKLTCKDDKSKHTIYLWMTPLKKRKTKTTDKASGVLDPLPDDVTQDSPDPEPSPEAVHR